MQLERLKRFELVELTISNTNPGRFNFVTQPQLRNQADQIIFIKGIKVYTDLVYAFSQVTPTIPGMPNGEIAKAVLVLYVDGSEDIKMIPLAEMNNINDLANPFQQEMQGFADLQNVAWEKSYVQFSVAPSGVYVIPFGVAYVRMKRDPSQPDKWIEV